MRSCMRNLFISVEGRGWGVSASLCRALFAWRGGLSCVFSIFDAAGSVRVCVCVNTHAHTHTARGVLDVRPGVRTRHLEGPKNPDGLNLGIYVFMYVYRVHMCI